MVDAEVVCAIFPLQLHGFVPRGEKTIMHLDVGVSVFFRDVCGSSSCAHLDGLVLCRHFELDVCDRKPWQQEPFVNVERSE